MAFLTTSFQGLKNNYSTVQYESVLVFLSLSYTTKPDVFLETAIGAGIGAGGGGAVMVTASVMILVLRLIKMKKCKRSAQKSCSLVCY